MAATDTTPGVLRVLVETIDKVHSGEVVGVTVIAYDPAWGWDTASAGSVLRSPAIGIAAGHMYVTQMERRLRAADRPIDRRA